MIPDAARMRRWMLQGMPAIGLCALGMHAGGGAAGMLLWMAAGVFCLPKGRYPYPRKAREKPVRLFFSLSAGIFFLSLPVMLIETIDPAFFARNLFSSFLLQLGSACMASTLCARLITVSLPQRALWYGGLHLGMLSLLFIFYTQ